MYMNGRSIASWGFAATASSTITHALCEPDDRWSVKQDGVMLKQTGIEARCFAFAPTPATTSIANDGGLIEVQVFRAKGRRRRTPMLNQYRNRERYGIRCPSSGLVNNPEDMAYYDWVLDDPTDQPWAVFDFHYRSWRYLCELNLTTQDVQSSIDDTDLLPLLAVGRLSHKGKGDRCDCLAHSSRPQRKDSVAAPRVPLGFRAFSQLPRIEEEEESGWSNSEDPGIESEAMADIIFHLELLGRCSAGRRPLPKPPTAAKPTPPIVRP